MSLYEKIFNVMNESEGLEKNLSVGTGTSSYKAIGEAEVLNMLKPLFKRHKLIVFPVDGTITEQNSTFDSEYNGKVTVKTRNVTQIKVNFKIVDIESGESEILVGFGNGADSQDKGSGKSFTYAYKTMLSKTFMLFSGEDTDNDHSDDIGSQNKSKGTLPPQQTNESTGQFPAELISEPQAKRLFALSKGNVELVKKVLLLHKYTESKLVKKSEYEAICKEIEKGATT